MENVEHELYKYLNVFGSNHIAFWIKESIKILDQTDNYLKYSFCALGIREALSIYLKGEDSENDKHIQECDWFEPKYENQSYYCPKCETKHKNIKCKDEKCGTSFIINKKISQKKDGISWADRVRYSIHKNICLEDLDIPDFEDEINNIARQFRKLYSDLSDFTHNIDEINSFEEKGYAEKMLAVIEYFTNLLKQTNTIKENIQKKIKSEIGNNLNNYAWSENFDDLDCLSSHGGSVEWVNHDEFLITEEDHKYIYISGSGTADCEHHFKDEGECLSFPNNYPFTYEGKVALNNLDSIEIEFMKIDTSSWEE